jgi:choline dehydrogenase-like flavoprotein
MLFEDISPGGLTNHWSCAVPRFSPEDFLDARRAGEEFVWPVEYDDLAPWYDVVEPWLKISGTVTDVPLLPAGKVRRLRSIGGSWNAVAEAVGREGRGLVPTPYVYGAETTLTASGTVFNSFVRLVKPALRSGHLAVRYGALVTRLEWSGAAKRVRAAIIRDAATGVEHRVACRAVVLAAGAINTAKLLLQSTDADFPAGLGNTHGVLGAYLHDHPIAKLEIELASPLSFHPAVYLTRAPLARSTPLYAAACLQWGGTSLLGQSLMRATPGRLTWCGFNVFGTMAPVKSNSVGLDRERLSPDGVPGTVLHINHPPESQRNLEAARDQLLTLLQTAGLKPRVRRWYVDVAGSSVHYAGTCRMHSSPAFGMLDQWNRLHAVKNVAVVDSAAFTTGPEKNPVLTAMALSARASHRIADDLHAGVI